MEETSRSWRRRNYGNEGKQISPFIVVVPRVLVV